MQDATRLPRDDDVVKLYNVAIRAILKSKDYGISEKLSKTYTAVEDDEAHPAAEAAAAAALGKSPMKTQTFETPDPVTLSTGSDDVEVVAANVAEWASGNVSLADTEETRKESDVVCKSRNEAQTTAEHVLYKLTDGFGRKRDDEKARCIASCCRVMWLYGYEIARLGLDASDPANEPVTDIMSSIENGRWTKLVQKMWTLHSAHAGDAMAAGVSGAKDDDDDKNDVKAQQSRRSVGAKGAVLENTVIGEIYCRMGSFAGTLAVEALDGVEGVYTSAEYGILAYVRQKFETLFGVLRAQGIEIDSSLEANMLVLFRAEAVDDDVEMVPLKKSSHVLSELYRAVEEYGIHFNVFSHPLMGDALQQDVHTFTQAWDRRIDAARTVVGELDRIKEKAAKAGTFTGVVDMLTEYTMLMIYSLKKDEPVSPHDVAFNGAASVLNFAEKFVDGTYFLTEGPTGGASAAKVDMLGPVDAPHLKRELRILRDILLRLRDVFSEDVQEYMPVELVRTVLDSKFWPHKMRSKAPQQTKDASPAASQEAMEFREQWAKGDITKKSDLLKEMVSTVVSAADPVCGDAVRGLNSKMAGNFIGQAGIESADVAALSDVELWQIAVILLLHSRPTLFILPEEVQDDEVVADASPTKGGAGGAAAGGAPERPRSELDLIVDNDAGEEHVLGRFMLALLPEDMKEDALFRCGLYGKPPVHPFLNEWKNRIHGALERLSDARWSVVLALAKRASQAVADADGEWQLGGEILLAALGLAQATCGKQRRLYVLHALSIDIERERESDFEAYWQRNTLSAVGEMTVLLQKTVYKWTPREIEAMLFYYLSLRVAGNTFSQQFESVVDETIKRGIKVPWDTKKYHDLYKETKKGGGLPVHVNAYYSRDSSAHGNGKRYVPDTDLIKAVADDLNMLKEDEILDFVFARQRAHTGSAKTSDDGNIQTAMPGGTSTLTRASGTMASPAPSGAAAAAAAAAVTMSAEQREDADSILDRLTVYLEAWKGEGRPCNINDFAELFEDEFDEGFNQFALGVCMFGNDMKVEVYADFLIALQDALDRLDDGLYDTLYNFLTCNEYDEEVDCAITTPPYIYAMATAQDDFLASGRLLELFGAAKQMYGRLKEDGTIREMKEKARRDFAVAQVELLAKWDDVPEEHVRNLVCYYMQGLVAGYDIKADVKYYLYLCVCAWMEEYHENKGEYHDTSGTFHDYEFTKMTVGVPDFVEFYYADDFSDDVVQVPRLAVLKEEMKRRKDTLNSALNGYYVEATPAPGKVTKTEEPPLTASGSTGYTGPIAGGSAAAASAAVGGALDDLWNVDKLAERLVEAIGTERKTKLDEGWLIKLVTTMVPPSVVPKYTVEFSLRGAKYPIFMDEQWKLRLNAALGKLTATQYSDFLLGSLRASKGSHTDPLTAVWLRIAENVGSIVHEDLNTLASIFKELFKEAEKDYTDSGTKKRIEDLTVIREAAMSSSWEPVLLNGAVERYLFIVGAGHELDKKTRALFDAMMEAGKELPSDLVKGKDLYNALKKDTLFVDKVARSVVRFFTGENKTGNYTKTPPRRSEIEGLIDMREDREIKVEYCRKFPIECEALMNVTKHTGDVGAGAAQDTGPSSAAAAAAAALTAAPAAAPAASDVAAAPVVAPVVAPPAVLTVAGAADSAAGFAAAAAAAAAGAADFGNAMDDAGNGDESPLDPGYFDGANDVTPLRTRLFASDVDWVGIDGYLQGSTGPAVQGFGGMDDLSITDNDLVKLSPEDREMLERAVGGAAGAAAGGIEYNFLYTKEDAKAKLASLYAEITPPPPGTERRAGVERSRPKQRKNLRSERLKRMQKT